MKTQHPIQFRRQRKFLLVLPLLLLPFLTLAFWALGGGKNTPGSHQLTTDKGLNTQLPGAQFDKHEKPKDKMSFYDLAKQDSVKTRQGSANSLAQQFGGSKPADPNVALINEKMAAINKQISQPQTSNSAPAPAEKMPDGKALSKQVDKLETMMKAVNSSQGEDPQIVQLSKMLSQIQDIQHPGSAKAATVAGKPDSAFKAIPATIEGNQKVLPGGAVRLRLSDTICLKGQVIPKGTLAFGTANITNQRLLLDIKNIRLGNAIIPVDLTVYSFDGMPGIPAPEAELAGAAGSGADNALESMQFLSMDQSLATQAAAGGIQAAKGLFSKKVRRIKVHLKNNYRVLLRNNDHSPLRP